MLGVLAKADGEFTETSRLVEIYTMEGLLQIMWHGAPGATDVALMCGGAMGGMLGPGRSLYLELGLELAAEGRAAMAVGYRKPGDLPRCLLDTCAAADLALRNGAERFVILGHSFGGAVAIQAASTFTAHTAGVITYATQSAGCEEAARLGTTPLLLLHGERDSILGPENSMMVQTLAGTGEVRTFPETDHLMAEAAEEIAQITGTWVREKFATHAARA
ncbi:MAG: alpha/beta hydrolase [Acidimicrobiales bacterium]|nr:MAG: alpha/beta hydrolase [Acidimicrobiales bacterium]